MCFPFGHTLQLQTTSYAQSETFMAIQPPYSHISKGSRVPIIALQRTTRNDFIVSTHMRNFRYLVLTGLGQFYNEM